MRKLTRFTALVVGVVAFGLLFVFSDARELWRTASTLDPVLLTIPFLLGLLSYALMALSYRFAYHDDEIG